MKILVSFVLILTATIAAVAGVPLHAAEPAAPAFGWKTGYPGPPPGRAVITCDGSTITVGNAAIAMSWTCTEAGLRGIGVVDVPSGHRCEATGELFQVVLNEGQTYSASTLSPERSPLVRDLAPAIRASRLADRIPGRQVEVPLRSSDGRLRVIWRAFARDNGNSLRQEIEIKAANEDLVVREIVWLDGNLRGAGGRQR